MAPPNIVWITLDSVRSDHTLLDGYERDTTPTLLRLGNRGHGFSNCIAHGKSTLPSTGTILTGYPPARNTLGVSGSVLPEAIPTIPERFADAGYTTAGLSRNSYLSSATGLDRGFERFQWLSSSTLYQAGLRTLLKYARNIRRHSAGFTLDTAKHASPLLMNETAKRWLDDFETSSEPFFFYLHYNEPHRPYYPPGKYLDEYADGLSMSPKEAAEFALEVHYNSDEVIADGCELSEEEWAALEAMYDAEIAYTDEMVGTLVEYVRSLDLSDTVVVVTADHGELFGEYGLLAHSYVLHDAVTRVPLVIDGLSDELTVGADDIVQHSDVMTTLLEVAGAETGDTVGVDLRTETPNFAISQRGPASFDGILEHNSEYDTSEFHGDTLTALRTEEFKYQTSGEREELFELPDEREDVSGSYPDVTQSLASKLEAWMTKFGQPVSTGEEAEFSEAVEQQLRELGYLD